MLNLTTEQGPRLLASTQITATLRGNLTITFHSCLDLSLIIFQSFRVCMNWALGVYTYTVVAEVPRQHVSCTIVPVHKPGDFIN